MIDFSRNIEFLLAFVSAILGLSVPVMLQVIERVDQRYESTRIAERLKREPIVIACLFCLILSLFCSAYAVFVHIPSPCDCWLMNNSADLLALSFCIALIVCFLFSCKVILAYYNPEKLQDRILRKFNKAKRDKDKEGAFLDWVDLTKALLQSADREPAFKVYDTLGRAIYKAFEMAGDEGVVYPSYLVRGITSINENLCLMQRRPYSINNGNQILKNLIGEPTKLSDEGYRLLWSNLQLQLFYNQEDWVHEYWSAAVQNYDLGLQKLYEGEPTYYDDGKVVASKDVLRRDEQRKRYLEFHIALCASILREQRYDLLEKLMEYYRSMAPEYEYPLVPSSVAEVLDAFEKVATEKKDGFAEQIIDIDAEVSLKNLNGQLIKDIREMKPYGQSNPQPLFVYKGIKVQAIRTLKDDKHLKLVLKDNRSLIEAVGFSMGERRDELRIGDKVDILGTIELNTFNNPPTIQFILQDFKKSVE